MQMMAAKLIASVLYGISHEILPVYYLVNKLAKLEMGTGLMGWAEVGSTTFLYCQYIRVDSTYIVQNPLYFM